MSREVSGEVQYRRMDGESTLAGREKEVVDEECGCGSSVTTEGYGEAQGRASLGLGHRAVNRGWGGIGWVQNKGVLHSGGEKSKDKSKKDRCKTRGIT